MNPKKTAINRHVSQFIFLNLMKIKDEDYILNFKIIPKRIQTRTFQFTLKTGLRHCTSAQVSILYINIDIG